MDMDFDDFKEWLFAVDPENRTNSMILKLVAYVVLTSHKNPNIVTQAQQIVAG